MQACPESDCEFRVCCRAYGLHYVNHPGPELHDVQGCPESYFEFRVQNRAVGLHYVNQTGPKLNDVQAGSESYYEFRNYLLEGLDLNIVFRV